ncbi:MAG TPA: hypothetical protein EYG86_01865 [Crocinitomicaceae bacterium]|nr:hypothetical protein [Crocinitomicaceae bacterium]
MDSSVFYDLLETPHKSDLLSDELQQMVDDYPWFVHGHMLYSKSLQLLNDSSFDEQLHKTSVYTPDREVLYKLIVTEEEKRELVESPDKVFSINPNEIESEPENSSSSKEAWTDLKEEKIVFRLLEDEHTKKKENIGGLGSPETKPLEETVIRLGGEDPVLEEKELEEIKKPRVLDVLEKEIIIGAVSRVIEKEVEEELPESISVEEPQTDKSLEVESEEEINFSSFTAMILKRAKEVKYIDSNVRKDNASGQIKRFEFGFDSEKSLKEKKKRLLDKFIALNPQITRGKLSDYESVNLGQESLKDSDFFITETMARIYAQQGKIGKAKKTYKLLSLKYPEKSVYFAARIKNLDKK